MHVYRSVVFSGHHNMDQQLPLDCRTKTYRCDCEVDCTSGIHTNSISSPTTLLPSAPPSPTLLLPLFPPSPPFPLLSTSSSSSPSHSPYPPFPCPLPPRLLVECLGADTKVVRLINQVIQPLSSSENSLDGIMLQVKGGTRWVKDGLVGWR